MSHRAKASIYKDTHSAKIYNRNLPSVALEPYLSFIPIATKYNKIEDFASKRNQDLNENKIETRQIYNQMSSFNPGSKAPWKGYSENVDKESVLRNQIYALQKCSQSVYVPRVDSDLYNYEMKMPQVRQTHPLLFKDEQFNEYNPNFNTKQTGNGLFFNHTRNQLNHY